MICRPQKPRKPLQGLFVDILVYQPRGKTLAVSLTKYRIKEVRLKYFKIKKGGSKTFQKKKANGILHA